MEKKEINKKLFIRSLEERAKELNCLYQIDEILNSKDISTHEMFEQLLKTFPIGFQYVDDCCARIVVEGDIYLSENYRQTKWHLSSDLKIQEMVVGMVDIYYLSEFPDEEIGPFLKEEKRLLVTIADRISNFLFYQKLKTVFRGLNDNHSNHNDNVKPEWETVLNLVKHTDQNLFSIISRKMIIQLFTRGIEEAQEIFSRIADIESEGLKAEINKPSQRQILEKSSKYSHEIFEVASKNMTEEEILNIIQKWINEEKLLNLNKTLATPNTPISEIFDVLRKYFNSKSIDFDETSSVMKGIRAWLVRRFLTDQLEYINIAKNFCHIYDFFVLLQNLIYPNDSHGKLGGKTAGLFLAKKILEEKTELHPILKNVKTPKTWYITSDAIMHFMYYNNLEDIIEQKYKDIIDIRHEYSYVIQAFKNAGFPPELINGLSRALDDFGDNPIIVRSSSLLEDRLGAIFAGKYKSLFLANQGSKQQRLEALCDAIAEVYASIFGPDPIGYRIERGLLDFNEEMGIMIQEVVGVKSGNYFFPAFAGVAFSNNEFRWSPRIQREDGLIRLVPGLGTRAVDRVSDDYPILIAPGKPNFKLNLTFQQTVTYSPKNIDLINLETNTFETVSIDEVLKTTGNDYPLINQVFSILEQSHIKSPVGLGIDLKRDDIVVTFENLISQTNYINQIYTILGILKETLGVPVDIEFACDGNNLYLLQCRPQSSGNEFSGAVIPTDIPSDDIIFTTNKHVSNGKMPDIQYLVIVDPIKYSEISSLEDLKMIGRIVGLLNHSIPKKKFILMGPGRWGSRGDIRLGVNVSYTDINNSSMLIEIAKSQGGYLPDLSFGTHFFQDLVESDIKYLPLYPDDIQCNYNENFITNAENILTRFLPDFEQYSNIIKVINISESSGGRVLKILMNAEEEKAIAFLSDAVTGTKYTAKNSVTYQDDKDEPSRYRWSIAEKIASEIFPNMFGVDSIYLFGTVFYKSALPSSDLDLLVIYDGNPENKAKLEIWFDGWNKCIRDIHYNITGYKIDKFIDVVYVTESDLSKNEYYRDMVNPTKSGSYKLKLKDI